MIVYYLSGMAQAKQFYGWLWWPLECFRRFLGEVDCDDGVDWILVDVACWCLMADGMKLQPSITQAFIYKEATTPKL